jgi:hypothetical protein
MKKQTLLNILKKNFFLYFFLYIYSQIDSSKLYAFSIKNDNAKIKSLSSSGLHKPDFNPGGVKFSEDQEFFNSYQKKDKLNANIYNDINDYSFQRNINQSELSDIYYGSDIIGATYIESLDKIKENEIYSKNFFCINNNDIPEELMAYIYDKCNNISYENYSLHQDNNSNSPLLNHRAIDNSKSKKSLLKINKKNSYKNKKELIEDNKKFTNHLNAINSEEPVIKFKE